MRKRGRLKNPKFTSHTRRIYLPTSLPIWFSESSESGRNISDLMFAHPSAINRVWSANYKNSRQFLRKIRVFLSSSLFETRVEMVEIIRNRFQLDIIFEKKNPIDYLLNYTVKRFMILTDLSGSKNRYYNISNVELSKVILFNNETL